jgi:class 3 adenylate cyclase
MGEHLRVSIVRKPELHLLISARVLAAVDDLVEVEPVGELTLKGFARPVPAFNVLKVR